MEDDLTVVEMRDKVQRKKPKKPAFMQAGELRVIRKTILRVTMVKLAEQLIRPDIGESLKWNTISFWENGHRPIPLWAARRIRDLAEVARRYDRKVIDGIQ